MKFKNTSATAFLTILFLCLLITLHAQDTRSDKLSQKANKRLSGLELLFPDWQHLGEYSMDSLKVFESEKEMKVYFSKELGYMPVRETDVETLQRKLKEALKRKFRNYNITVYTGGYEYSKLIPNAFRIKSPKAGKRMSPEVERSKVLVRNRHQEEYKKGLSQKHIALWPSHGYYYENSLDRWEWQRARLFSTVEDILPMAFVTPYLVPMLEQSGANVFTPRERDFQLNELIVDNDISTNDSEFILYIEAHTQKGFAYQDTLFPGDNPFEMGTSLRLESNQKKNLATYLPSFREGGYYNVYVSYRADDGNKADVEYVVHHSGGTTTFMVDQRMGGGTWINLGQFHFHEGKDISKGSVIVNAEGQVSLDAVRFGGGMGNVARRNSCDSSWKLSGKPRYMEAARYYMQYAGVPDTLVFSLNNEQKDYNDDYQSRGEWVNYLMGTSRAAAMNQNIGLNIPIDLAFAFHTDAGTTSNDSLIGTLGIYSSIRDSGLFPNGQSKLASRDLTDIVQSQLVQDIQLLYDVSWTRRAMWDKQYSEAWRPNVPTMLLELLSHQNLADMRYALDPEFRFNVSRSIYKAILKYLANQVGREYVVHPLPVDHMAIQATGEKFEISWEAVEDPLEPSAKASGYKLYKRIGNNGFDNGIWMESNNCLVEMPPLGEIHSYKVTAINEGGESMPSEILSLGRGESEKTVLVVNAFDRVSEPVFVDENGFAGIAWWEDEGVADKFDYSYVGTQYDYNRNSPWLDDDSPGWGASYGDQEGLPRPGNSFDFSIMHGEAIIAAGFSFVSMSDEVFNLAETDVRSYHCIDVILGEEKANVARDKRKDYQVFSPVFRAKLQDAKENTIPMILSGAYVGSDMQNLSDTLAIAFAKDVLGFKWRSNHASKDGHLKPTDTGRTWFSSDLEFNTKEHHSLYKVEAPDAIEPSHRSKTVYRYSENNSSAMVYDPEGRVIIMGFPFETILKAEQRSIFMKELLEALIEK